jgi:hypothetical protein
MNLNVTDLRRGRPACLSHHGHSFRFTWTNGKAGGARLLSIPGQVVHFFDSPTSVQRQYHTSKF